MQEVEQCLEQLPRAQACPERSRRGCEKQIKKEFHLTQKWLARSDVAIHGYWIPAFPAGMTGCLDADAQNNASFSLSPCAFSL